MTRGLLLVGVCVLASSAGAQTGSQGSATLRGEITPALSLTFGGSDFTAVSIPGAFETAPAVDAALGYTANFGDLATQGVVGFQRVRVWLHLRTNLPYQLRASFSDDVPTPGSVLPSSAIGFAIKGVSWNPMSPRVAPRGPPMIGIPSGSAGASDTINQTFFVSGFNGNEPEPGIPSYAAALGMLSSNPLAPTPLLEGPRVSNGGSFGSADNQLRVELELAVLPEPFLPAGTFHYTVTLTVVQP